MKMTLRQSLAAACGAITLLSLASCGDPAPQSSGGPATVRRVTQEQYTAIIGDIFGADIKIQGRFDPDVRESGLLAIGTAHVSVTPSSLEQYDSIARTVAAQVVDEHHRAQLFGCQPASAGQDPDEALDKLALVVNTWIAGAYETPESRILPIKRLLDLLQLALLVFRERHDASH